jgi:hypothetical protein
MLSCKEKISLEREWKRRRDDCKYRKQQNQFVTKERGNSHMRYTSLIAVAIRRLVMDSTQHWKGKSMHEFKDLPAQADLRCPLKNQTNQEGVRRIYGHTCKKERKMEGEERFFTFD